MDRILRSDRSSRIGRQRYLGAATIVAATFVTYAALAPAARAESKDASISPAAAATYPAGDVGTAAPAVTDAAAAADRAAAEAASASAGAEPTQYHQRQTAQYHGTTAVLGAAANTKANIRAIAGAASTNGSPARARAAATAPRPRRVPVHVAMRLSRAARMVGAAHSQSGRTVADAVSSTATPAAIRVLTGVIAPKKLRDISVSRKRNSVVSVFRVADLTVHSTAAPTQRNATSIAVRNRVESPQTFQAKDRDSAVGPPPAHAARSAALPPLTSASVKNARAMIQLGILFGLAYLGFLVIWFWSTRSRRRVRPTLRL